jgi:predicted alpha/beta-fold hydrolase
VRAVVQAQPAPLIVVLLGITGRANTDFSRVWPSWLAEAGYNVLYFDSTFLTVGKASGRPGVAGNLFAEAELCRDIIEAYLKQTGAGERVTEIGVVGMSYGGTLALILGQMAVKGELPFRLDGVQAYSPPVDMKNSAAIIDRWHARDRWRFTLAQLQPMEKHKPVASSGKRAPFEDCMLRAGIAAAFRLALVNVVLDNNETYNLNKLLRGDEFNDKYVQQDHAGTINFLEYAYDFAYPYWEQKLNMPLEDLIQAANLCTLIKNQSGGTEVIVTADDPLNNPEDKAQLQACAAEGRVTMLPKGGHLGYVNNPWTRTKLLSMFGGGGVARAIEKKDQSKPVMTGASQPAAK